jgi:type II secretion system protein I
MSSDWKIGRLEGWKHGKCDGENSSLQSSRLPSVRSSARNAGFSLLEVLVALAVFGIAAGGVLVALGHHLKNVSFLQDHARAVRIASREMNALRRMTSFEEGETEGAEDRFSWVAQVTAEGLDEWPGLEDSEGIPALLSVTVKWSDSGDGPALGRVHLDGFEVFGAEE